VQVSRQPAVRCPGCEQIQERAAVRRAIDAKRAQLFCDACGSKLTTPRLDEIGVPPEGKAETVHAATELADQRTEYEVAISWVKGFRRERGDPEIPTCFISYAWGDSRHERWVEDLADLLQQADIAVILDRWHCRPASDLAAFIERIENATFVCATGTPRYREKYDTPGEDPVVRAELRLINARHMKRDARHDTVIPLLREGSPIESFPPLLRTSVFIDIRNDQDFLARLFDLVLTIHRMGFDEPMARKHRLSIAGGDKR
jgi:TIR domain